MGTQPALRLKEQMESSGRGDQERLYVGTWDRLKERLIEEISNPHTFLSVQYDNIKSELPDNAIKHGRVSRASVIKELKKRDDDSARDLITAIITDNFKVSSIAAYATLTDAMLGRCEGIIIEHKPQQAMQYEPPALAS
jgi:hypothetical protein